MTVHPHAAEELDVAGYEALGALLEPLDVEVHLVGLASLLLQLREHGLREVPEPAQLVVHVEQDVAQLTVRHITPRSHS